MTKCKLCGNKLKNEKEEERGICHECMHEGFWKLAEVLGEKIKKGEIKNIEN